MELLNELYHLFVINVVDIFIPTIITDATQKFSHWYLIWIEILPLVARIWVWFYLFCQPS